MKLLHIASAEVVVWSRSELPPYAIFPYPYTQNQQTGEAQEPSIWATDTSCGKKLPIPDVIISACKKALGRGIHYLWVKSLCVDTASLMDVEKAADNSFGRLRDSALCIIFLEDLPAHTSSSDEKAWATCRYWARASAAQELVVAPHVEFYDQKWNHICSKSSPEYLEILSKVSKIPTGVLAYSDKLFNTSNTRGNSPGMGQTANHTQQLMTRFTRVHPLQHTFSPRLACHSEKNPPMYPRPPTQACFQHHTSRTSPAEAPAGTKRDRSGQPLNAHSGCGSRTFSFNSDLGREDRYDDSSTCDESESNSDSSESGSDSESEMNSDEEDFELDNPISNEVYQAVNEQFRVMKPELIDFVYEKVEKWMSTASYVPPPDDRLPPRKRARTGERQPQSTLYFRKIDKDDPNIVTVTRVDGYFHFACPYYLSNPTKHQKCLRKHDLQSVEDVIQHIGRNHREPPYCPRCCRPFEGARERDRHFLARVCETSTSRDVEGITERQRLRMEKMEKHQNLYMGERKRWLKVRAIAFPNTELGSSKTPYLESTHEIRVGMARDYWARNATDIVQGFLSKNTQAQVEVSQDGRAMRIIEGLVLDEIIDRIIRDQEVVVGK
ncbi:unnamed protein product [Clonostachys rosea]|uniref:Heterokaryon incompatibility domain-containing protein n=1 Tax=Bionectria ochroleuca TaxID=29856 RepID=A0ABY6TRK2_BIOOC|nr:unnamed protein product [Clonostachys rosea]